MKFKSRASVRSFHALPLAIALGFSGCSGSKSEAPLPAAPTPMDLVRADSANLRATEQPGFAKYDRDSGGIFTKIFGGTTNKDVANFIDERLHHYFDPENPGIRVTPENIFEQPWSNLPQPNSPQPDAPQKGEIGAVNLGTSLWVASMILKTPVYFYDGAEEVQVTSTRTGIMMIGPGYRDSITLENGQKIAIPATYRQSILAHEARHSDCTGGITAAEIGIREAVRTFEDLSRYAGKVHCGHSHIICPSGDYAGQFACDSEAWGAYTVGEMHLRGAVEHPDLSELDYQILSSSITDFAARTLVNRTGNPDMSSAGLRY